MTNDTTTLVLGGTGKTGRRIVSRLQDRGVPVRVGSRSGSPAFDWDDEATWGPAVAGAGAVYFAYAPDIAIPGAAAKVVGVASAAIAAGATRLVLLSGRGEEEAQACEKLIADLDADVTIVRASWFAQNFSEAQFLDGVRSGVVALPAPAGVPEPFIDADDIADVAVAALLDDGHAGQLYEVTGPRALTFPEAVAEVGRACGRPIGFEFVPPDAFAAVMTELGEPPEVIELITYLFTTVLDGRNAESCDGVQRALGREPRDFYDWAWATARTGVWDA